MHAKRFDKSFVLGRCRYRQWPSSCRACAKITRKRYYRQIHHYPTESQLHFIPVFLVNPNFAEFETAVTAHPLTESLYKISGKWCYHLQITSENNTEFDKFLTFLLQYGYGGTLAGGVWVYSNISKSHFFTLKKSNNNTFWREKCCITRFFTLW